jgi:hypothetical protein
MLFVSGVSFVLGDEFIVQVLKVPQMGNNSERVLLLSAFRKVIFS